MSSFVAEALAAIGMTGDSDRCQADLEKLTSQSEELKVEIMTFLKSQYEDFDGFVDKTCSLYRKVEELNAQLTSTTSLLQCQLQAKRSADSSSQLPTSELEKVTQTISILDILMQLHKLYQQVNSGISSEEFVESSKRLAEMRNLLGRLEQWPDLHITRSLKVEHTMLAETLKHSLTEEWNKLIRVTKPENDKPENQTYTIRWSRSYQPTYIAELSTALHMESMLRMRLKPLGDAVNTAFDWIVNFPSTMVEETVTEGEVTIEVKKSTENRSPSPPGVVFSQLTKLLQQLGTTLLMTKFVNTDQTIMTELRHHWGSKPVDLVVKQCLMPSVPTNHADLEKYSEVMVGAEQFENFLLKIGFLSDGSSTLTGYLGNLNVLFANKKCQDVLTRARHLMKQELFNTVKLQPGDDSTKWSNFVASPERQTSEADQAHINRLSESTLKFPVCSISEAAVKLIELAHEMMDEACNSNNAASCSHIIYSVRSMFELYTSVVPDYHRDSLDQLPQVTALYYNNCMYLSHQLITLASQYKNRLTSLLDDTSTVTFIDLVPLLRSLGTERFIEQIQTQRQELLDCLKNAQGFKTLEVKGSYEQAYQAIKQCKLQLDHLRKVWVDVLPLSNYCKAIGHLIGCVMSEMVSSALSIEDFSADGASKLHQLMCEVQSMSPGLFPGDKPTALGYAHKHIPCFTKFKELGVVLTAPLQDIVDRWADGKGPLADEFSSVQVKGLIRALFQNTERRSACLSKIK